VSGPTFDSGDLGFAPAARADDADIRRLLRENATDGWIRLALAREPDAFAAAAAMGRTHAYVIARSRMSNEAVGVCEWSVRDAFVNGDVVSLAYLGALRIAPTHRHRIRVLRGGFDVVRALMQQTRCAPSPHPNSGLPEFGTLDRPKSDKSDFGWGEGWGEGGRGPSRDQNPSPHPSPYGRGSGASLLLGRGITPYALTAIAADNRAALRVLGANLPGMPTYRPLEPFSTFALRPARASSTAIRVERARADDLAAIAVCLERAYRHFQFAPVWSARDLADRKRCPGLAPEDFLIVRRGPGIAACAALWDQSGFKQTVVRGYAGWVAALRPLANAAAPLLRMPRLPAAGQPLRQVYLSHLAVADNDPRLFQAIVDAGLTEAHRRGFAVVLTGLATRHSLASELGRRYRHREYRALLHLVHWPEGAAAVEALTPRPPHPEIALM
jgi:hypothetical protein